MDKDAAATFRTSSRRFGTLQRVSAPGRSKTCVCDSGLEQSSTVSSGDENISAMGCVSNSPLFAGLPFAVARELAATAVQRTFSDRQLIFRQGDPVRCVYVIGCGSVKITHLTQSGDEVILRLERSGGAIDDLDLTHQQMHSTGASAIRDCCVLTWGTETFRNIAETYPAIERNITRILQRRLRMLENSICDLGTARVPQRLARLLLQLSQQDGLNFDSIGLSREELAQMVGTSTFVVSRFLSEWSERGVVHVTRQETIIENRACLVALASGKEKTPLSSDRRPAVGYRTEPPQIV